MSDPFGVAEYVIGFISGVYLAGLVAYDLYKQRRL